MKKNILCLIGMLLVLFAGSIQAQDLDPANPPEPLTYYKVMVSAAPYGYTSGEGSYLSGTEVTISTSSYSTDYTFSHWTKNGVKYSEEPSFQYVVDGQKAVFVAHYDFTPVDPQEPMGEYRHRLFLRNNILQACSFNMSSGVKVDDDTYVHVVAYTNTNYDFIGWFDSKGVKVSEEPSFNYLMGTENTTLEARFNYNPINPDEPMGGLQDDVANGLLGDVNEDEVVNVTDAIELINSILANKTSSLNIKLCDMNKDGEVNVTDAIEIINTILKGN